MGLGRSSQPVHAGHDLTPWHNFTSSKIPCVNFVVAPAEVLPRYVSSMMHKSYRGFRHLGNGIARTDSFFLHAKPYSQVTAVHRRKPSSFSSVMRAAFGAMELVACIQLMNRCPRASF